jgi:hypothetical protein
MWGRRLPLCAIALVAAACSAPVGVTRLSPQQQYRQLARNTLTGDWPR